LGVVGLVLFQSIHCALLGSREKEATGRVKNICRPQKSSEWKKKVSAEVWGAKKVSVDLKEVVNGRK